MAALIAGDDGRRDWMARKACNYITATIEECTNGLVGDCATEEEVNDMKDGQIDGLLEQLSDTIQEWDHEKCQPIKAYLDRKSPPEDEEESGRRSSSISRVCSSRRRGRRRGRKCFVVAISRKHITSPDVSLTMIYSTG